MHSIMSTKYTQGQKKIDYCTEFQLHKSQNSLSFFKNVFDYSEYRLKIYINHVIDEQQKFTLISVLKQYKSGLVAIAWKSGKPVWLKVTKEKV